MHQAKKRKSAASRQVSAVSAVGAVSAAEQPASHRGVRPRHRRRAYLLCGLAAAGLFGAALVAVNGGQQGTAASARARLPSRAAADATDPSSPLAPPNTPYAATSPATKPSAAKPTAATPRKPAAAGNPKGTDKSGFTTAEADGKAVGKGTVRRYEVRVEDGAGVSAGAAAHEIEGILADPRSWTADGHDAFQLVSGGSYDFEVEIASPDTVDRICGAAGLHTHGEVNCDVGSQVIVNLKRWNTGSPEFPGPLHDYRALIINHEVGHRIGHGHDGCPGPGRPAPAMMQQIDGLHGCVANAWPYDSHGTYLAGPPIP